MGQSKYLLSPGLIIGTILITRVLRRPASQTQSRDTPRGKHRKPLQCAVTVTAAAGKRYIIFKSIYPDDHTPQRTWLMFNRLH